MSDELIEYQRALLGEARTTNARLEQIVIWLDTLTLRVETCAQRIDTLTQRVEGIAKLGAEALPRRQRDRGHRRLRRCPAPLPTRPRHTENEEE